MGRADKCQLAPGEGEKLMNAPATSLSASITTEQAQKIICRLEKAVKSLALRVPLPPEIYNHGVQAQSLLGELYCLKQTAQVEEFSKLAESERLCNEISVWLLGWGYKKAGATLAGLAHVCSDPKIHKATQKQKELAFSLFSELFLKMMQGTIQDFSLASRQSALRLMAKQKERERDCRKYALKKDKTLAAQALLSISSGEQMCDMPEGQEPADEQAGGSPEASHREHMDSVPDVQPGFQTCNIPKAPLDLQRLCLPCLTMFTEFAMKLVIPLEDGSYEKPTEGRASVEGASDGMWFLVCDRVLSKQRPAYIWGMVYVACIIKTAALDRMLEYAHFQEMEQYTRYSQKYV